MAKDLCQVVSGPIGKERVHFEAPKADRLAGEMAPFLAWFESNVPAPSGFSKVIADICRPMRMWLTTAFSPIRRGEWWRWPAGRIIQTQTLSGVAVGMA
jgi:hypothetical protein